MGAMIEYPRPDGSRGAGYLAEPAGAKAAPGVVVLQEWWGLASPKSDIKNICERLAGEGIRALAPDLFHGKSAATSDEAMKLMQGLDFGHALSQDIAGAVQHLAKSGSKVGAIGFCLGGALSLLAAAKVPKLDGAVCFYGMPPAAAADLGAIRVPLLCHFANRDEFITSPSVDALEGRLKAGGVTHALHRYDADHAFMNRLRPEVYDAASDQLAWPRSIEFLRRTLG